jgi:phenylacetate-CoA ligase
MMNKNFLKVIRDQIPEPLKYITASLFRNKLVHNREFRKYYNLLNARENSDKEKITEYQLNNLKHILTYSYLNVPYYTELFNGISFDPFKFSDFDQMKAIPFLTREIILNNFDKLISTSKIKNGYYEAATGGSTGLPLKFYLDYDSIYKENAFIYYYRSKLGYEFRDKLTTFRQVEFGDKLWKFNPMYNEMIFSPLKLSVVTIRDYVQKIDEFGPHYLNGYLSAIFYFAKLMEQYEIPVNFKLKGIFLISENPDPNQRNFIEQFFNVKSLTFYGHSERAVIAEEIMRNEYLFDPYYGYTEQIHIENNIYAIVGTGFLNHKMPFIRYKTDDVCFPCNEHYLIKGKRNSTIGLYGINDEFIRSTAFLLRSPVFKNIITYQFIQHEKGKADLLMIVNKHFQMSEMGSIRKEINYQTKGVINLKIKIVDSLILSPRGKYQMFISNIGKE